MNSGRENNKKEVGVVISPSGIDEFDFLLTRVDEHSLKKGSYCTFEHPLYGVTCLSRVFDGEIKNPDMLPLSFGPILVKRGVELGKEEREVVLLKAEFLGYIDREGNFRSADFPPSPGQKVYKATKEEINNFFKRTEGINLTLGKDPQSDLELSLSIDLITKGHMAICGMTRSGKTTFVLNLIIKGIKENCHFLVIDRTGEYIEPLHRYCGEKMVLKEPRDFEALSDLNESKIISRLGLDRKRETDKKIASVLYDKIKKVISGDLYPEDINDVRILWEECAEGFRSDLRERIFIMLKQREEQIRKLTSMRTEPPNIVDLIKEHNIVLIDLSREKDIRSQQLAISNILTPIFSQAVATQGEDFTCIVVVEEAQFYAPERNTVSYGDPRISSEILMSSLSQLGGFNVGFLIITQRPAYVSKALLSQCNTFLTFRLMSGADHEQIASVTGYPRHRISKLLSGLPDHVGYLIGMASSFNFPTFIETVKEGRVYPRKATLTPSQVIERMKSS